MNKKVILAQLRLITGKPISECLKAFNSAANTDEAFHILLSKEINVIKERIKVKDDKLIVNALKLSKNNTEGATSILIHGYDIYSCAKTRYPEFLNENEKFRIYDDASWHYNGKFPKNLPIKNGATHIGLFLNWCIEKNLVSDFLEKELKNEIELVKKRKQTGTEFLINFCDEKFIPEMLNEIGNEFTSNYYEDNSDFGRKFNSYNNDYKQIFDNKASQNGFEYKSIYHIEDNMENYELLKLIIDKRFEEWEKYKNEKLGKSY